MGWSGAQTGVCYTQRITPRWSSSFVNREAISKKEYKILDLRHGRSVLPERYGTNEDEIVDELDVFPPRGPSKPCRSSFVKGRRSWVDRASSKLVEAWSTQPRRALARLDRPGLDGLRHGSIDPASTSDEARSTQLRRPLTKLDRQDFDGPRCGKTFSLSTMSSSFVS